VTDLVVDPRVSRAKFDREIAQYSQLESEYIRRGWWMMRAKFPEVVVVFATRNTQPPAVVFGVRLDFTNYDLIPPSVTLVNPFTREPYKGKDLPSQLVRRIPTAVPLDGTKATGPTGTTGATGTTPVTGAVKPPAPAAQFSPQPMMQFWNPEDVPFLCLPGVREYHDNPAHSGDSWLLHRGRGEGTLHFILDQLYRYGVQPMRVHVQVQVLFAAALDEVPT
jgi:putative metal binding uncharacterized protein